MKPYAFGVDIGGTTVKIGFFETSGTLTDKWEIPTRKEEGGSLILGDIASSMKEKMESGGISADDIEGIGVGVPGPVLEDAIVNKCANLGWGVINVAEELAKLTGVGNIKVGNDANVAALGEQWKGGAKGYKSCVMVTLGTGVGGGIIINGKILTGAFGAGGEIGHIKVSETETAACGCGRRGCLEQYCSATGIVRTARELINSSDRPSALKNVPYLSAREVFDEAKKGDELSLEIVETTAEKLGNALSNISCVVSPEVYVIGGGVSKAGDFLIDAIRRHYQKNAFHACTGTEIRLAELGNDAGMYGCARMVLQK